MEACPNCGGRIEPTVVVWARRSPGPEDAKRCNTCSITWLLFRAPNGALVPIDLGNCPAWQSHDDWIKECLANAPLPAS